MPGDDPAPLIKQTLYDNAVLVTRFVSMLSQGKNVPAQVHATYFRCLDRYLSNPLLDCRNPLAVILNMAERVVRGTLQVPGEVPPAFARHFTVGRTAVERAQWQLVEEIVHDRVSERLWPMAVLLFDSQHGYDFRSMESRERTRLWSSLLGIPQAEVRKRIDQIRRQINRGREGR